MARNYQSKETVLVITVGLLVLYVVFKNRVFLYCALGIGVAGVLSGYLAEKIHWVWDGLSKVLSAVTNRVLLGVVFFVVLTPMALIRRIAKKDALRRKLDRRKSDRRARQRGADGPTGRGADGPAGNATSNFSRREHVFEKRDLEQVW